jgi:16S rRNA (cytosine1402-N4)-methyltransferase
MPRVPRSTPEGEHRPVLIDEVMEVLRPQPGEFVADCTLGWAGHSVELLRRVGPAGRLIGLDFDAENLPRARERLEAVSPSFGLHHGNFAGLPAVLAAEGLSGVDVLLADLGMSSMQVDDPDRGFSYVRDGPLDMRMDRTRGRTAAQLLATIPQEELARALRELGDDPQADAVAAAVVAARAQQAVERTRQLSDLVLHAVQPQAQKGGWRLRPAKGKWQTHPAARLFQVVRILVNRELGNLEHLLRVLPDCLRPGGRAAIISFHSGEDRLVKAAFRDGLRSGVYQSAADEPVRPSFDEKAANPRSRSAKLRWAVRA